MDGMADKAIANLIRHIGRIENIFHCRINSISILMNGKKKSSAIFAGVLDEATGKYICSVCGYVYDPAEHDGVAFEDLPDDWKCPRCKQPKEKFNKA